MSSRSNKNLKVKLINRKDKIPEYSGVSIKTHKFMKIIKKFCVYKITKLQNTGTLDAAFIPGVGARNLSRPKTERFRNTGQKKIIPQKIIQMNVSVPL